MLAFLFVILAIVAVTGIIMRNRLAALTNLNSDTIVRIIIWVFFILVTIFGIRSCSSGIIGNGTAVGNGIWILLGGGLIVATVMTYKANPQNNKIPAFFILGVGIVMLVILGEFKNFFQWMLFGLPALAILAGIGWNYTEGRYRSFIGFAGGFIICLWLYIFITSELKLKMTFLGDRISDPLNLTLLLLAAILFGLSMLQWTLRKKGKILFISFLIVLVAWFGSEVFNRIQERFPDQLKIKFSEKWGETWKDVRDSSLDKISDAATEQVSAGGNSAPASDNTPVGKPFSKVFQAGEYSLTPATKISPDKKNWTGYVTSFVINKEHIIYFSNPIIQVRKEE